MKTFNIHKAKTHLSKLIQQALEGEEIIIANNGEPQVILQPYKPKTPREPGAWKGKVRIADDFDELPEEIEAAFRGESG